MEPAGVSGTVTISNYDEFPVDCNMVSRRANRLHGGCVHRQ